MTQTHPTPVPYSAKLETLGKPKTIIGPLALAKPNPVFISKKFDFLKSDDTLALCRGLLTAIDESP